MTWCLISRHNYFQELWNIGFQVFTNWYISYYLRIAISIFNIHIKIKWFWNILESVLSLCGLETEFHFSSFQRIICDQQFIFNTRLIVVQNNEKPKTFEGSDILFMYFSVSIFRLQNYLELYCTIDWIKLLACQFKK